MIFWNTFNILALRYIMNCFYTHPILKLSVYSIFILPNVWFYIRKFKSNRIDIQKILIINYLKKQRINYYLDNKIFEAIDHTKANDDLNLSLIGKGNDGSHSNLDRENEIEKFLEDYYNNAIYGSFFNLKIQKRIEYKRLY